MRQKQNRKTAVRSRGLVSATTTKEGCEIVEAACAICPDAKRLLREPVAGAGSAETGGRMRTMRANGCESGSGEPSSVLERRRKDKRMAPAVSIGRDAMPS